jgi:acyl CoA:acetate/3-ketoacid CoA transferase alpha subunit
MVLVPIAGIPDIELKALLSDDQWRAWKSSYTCSNATQNWTQIESMHKQAAQNSQ